MFSPGWLDTKQTDSMYVCSEVEEVEAVKSKAVTREPSKIVRKCFVVHEFCLSAFDPVLPEENDRADKPLHEPNGPIPSMYRSLQF